MKVVKDEEEKIVIVAPIVGRIQFNHIIITTDSVGQDSNIITSSTGKVDKSMLSEVQTVIAAVPNAGGSEEDNKIVAGDKVLVDVMLLNAKRAQGGQTRLIAFNFSKSTGELITSLNEKRFAEDDSVDYVMISDREILMVLP